MKVIIVKKKKYLQYLLTLFKLSEGKIILNLTFI